MAENDGLFGMGGMGVLIILFFLMSGGFGGFGGWGANGQVATSNEVQRGFDNQNSMANQREILGATNQVYHDLATVVGDKYSELTRDIYGVSNQVAQVLANQNACCCDTKMLIQETSAQNRYDSLLNTNAINATTIAQTQKILDAMAQNKIESLENKVRSLELAQATQNTVKYPNTFSYNAGPSPFCGGYGCGCGV
jgi:hypothetical protein